MKAVQKKILVVEDDVKAAKVLELRLKSAGYDVLVAHDGVEGLDLAKSESPDLVITDVWMPIGMGLALAYRLREFAPMLPILFLTGLRRAGVKRSVESFEPSRFMEKPYEPGELLRNIALLLGGPPPSEQPGCRASGPRLEKEQLEDPAPVSRKTPDTARKCILIVEDDRKISMTLSLRLKSAGYHTLLAADALRAVHMAVKHRPDLMLLDISMPAGDGFSVAERVSALVPTGLPMIFITASKRAGLREKARELGAAGFFEKPFKGDELVAAIDRALSSDSVRM